MTRRGYQKFNAPQRLQRGGRMVFLSGQYAWRRDVLVRGVFVRSAASLCLRRSCRDAEVSGRGWVIAVCGGGVPRRQACALQPFSCGRLLSVEPQRSPNKDPLGLV